MNLFSLDVMFSSITSITNYCKVFFILSTAISEWVSKIIMINDDNFIWWDEDITAGVDLMRENFFFVCLYGINFLCLKNIKFFGFLFSSILLGKKTFPGSLQNSVNEILIKLWGSQWVAVLPPSSFTIVIVWCHNEVVFWFLPQQNILIMTKYFHHHLPTLHAFYFLEKKISFPFPHLVFVLHYFLNTFFLFVVVKLNNRMWKSQKTFFILSF